MYRLTSLEEELQNLSRIAELSVVAEIVVVIVLAPGEQAVVAGPERGLSHRHAACFTKATL